MHGVSAVAGQVSEGLSGGRVDLYVHERDCATVLAEFALRADPDGQVVLHVISADIPPELAPRSGEPVSPSAAAAELLDAGDPRSRSAGTRLLAAAFDSLEVPAGRRADKGS